MAVQSASLVAAERSHQTLDVLCTTPLSGREIVLQKHRSVLRLMVVLAAPLTTVFLIGRDVRTQPVWGIRHGVHFDASLYLTTSFLSLAIYLPLVSWVSTAIGLMARSQGRAIMTAATGLFVWCVAPRLLVTMPLDIVMKGLGVIASDLVSWWELLSPATIIALNERDLRQTFSDPWNAVLANFTFYAALLVLARRLCLRNADRWLGRAGADGLPQPLAA